MAKRGVDNKLILEHFRRFSYHEQLPGIIFIVIIYKHLAK